MESLKNAVGMSGDDQNQTDQQNQGGLGGIGDKLNAAAVGDSSSGKSKGTGLSAQVKFPLELR